MVMWAGRRWCMGRGRWDGARWDEGMVERREGGRGREA